MNKISRLLTISAVSLALLTSASIAQDHHDDYHGQDHHDDNHGQDHHDDYHGQDHHDDNHDRGDHYVHHNDWRRGHRLDQADWARAQRVDYRRYHLHAPRRGYEWREVDGNYVLASIATGLISSVIIASSVR